MNKPSPTGRCLLTTWFLTLGFLSIAAGLLLSSTPAQALTNPERAYEMVTPPYKGGYGVGRIEGVAENGESVAFFSPGAFAGAPVGLTGEINKIPYLSRRGSSGWSTVPITPPADLLPSSNYNDISPSLTSVLAVGQSGRSFGRAEENYEWRFLVHSTETADSSANWEPGGGAFTFPSYADNQVSELKYLGGDPDFCHVLFSTGLPVTEKAIGLSQPLYEFNRGCGGEPAGPRLVAVNNEGNEGNPISPRCQVQLGSVHNTFHAISSDGSEIFFTTCINNNGADQQLFVRLGGTRTVEVSRSLSESCGASEIPCPGAGRASATFAGASEDGSKVYFTTTAPLVPGDSDASNNLYLASIGCPASTPGCSASEKVVTSLAEVSRGASGGEAGVLGVVRVAPDGSRVYFVATGDLLSAGQQATLESAGRAIPHAGADNLYVYDSATGETTFVGDLCAGHDLSGAVEDSACPSSTENDTPTWREGEAGEDAQTAGPAGEFLVFSTVAQLTRDDIDTARDVYRYDASTDTLDRVSIGEVGADDNGNNSAFGAAIVPDGTISSVQVNTQYGLNSRAISEDGSRIVFESAEALSPLATNGLTNVYEWHKEPGWSEGRVTLISGGSGETPVDDAVIDPSGENVFFLTTQQLLPQDTDEAPDIYDARLGGGFPVVPALAQPCSGDACQGPLTNPAPLLVPGSVSQAPGENLAPPPVAPAKAKPKAKPVTCKKGYVKKQAKCLKKPKRKRAKRSSRDRRTSR
jgi:hypothetical protein